MRLYSVTFMIAETRATRNNKSKRNTNVRLMMIYMTMPKHRETHEYLLARIALLADVAAARQLSS